MNCDLCDKRTTAIHPVYNSPVCPICREHPEYKTIAHTYAKRNFRLTDLELSTVRSGWYNRGYPATVYLERDLQELLKNPVIAERLRRKEERQKRPLGRCDLLLALFILNRRAKRCRDLAQNHYRNSRHGLAGHNRREKESIYATKEQALHYLVDDGRLTHAGYHQFDSGLWSEVLAGEGFIFHRPCPPVDGMEPGILDDIEAKPKGRKEPTLKVAHQVLADYLVDKPIVAVYHWPPRVRAYVPRWDDFDEFDSDDAFRADA